MYVHFFEKLGLQVPASFVNMFDPSATWPISIDQPLSCDKIISLSDRLIDSRVIYGFEKPYQIKGNWFIYVPGDVCKKLGLKDGTRLSCRLSHTVCFNELIFEKM